MTDLNKILVIDKPVSTPTTITKDMLTEGPQLSLNSNDGWLPLFSAGMSGTSSTGYYIDFTSAMQVPIFYACITRICADLAALPIRVNRYTTGSGWQELRNHPALKVLNRPNKRFLKYETIYTTYFNFLGTGNAFIATPLHWFGPNVALPKALIPLIPFLQASMPYEDYAGNLFYSINSKLMIDYQTSDGQTGYVRKLPSDEIIHMRQNSLNTGLWGQNPYSFLSDAIGIALAAQRINGTGIKNGMTSNGFLKPINRMGEQAVQQAQAAWSAATAGQTQAGKTPVLPGGYEYIKTTLTPAEFELGAIRDRQDKDIARALHVPGSLVGLTDGLASNYEAELNNYQSRCLTPLATLLEELLHEKWFFGDDFMDYELKFDFDYLGRADEISRTEVAGKQLMLGLRNRNQICDFERWTRPPEGDVYTQMMNVGSVGENGSDLPALPLGSNGVPNGRDGNKDE